MVEGIAFINKLCKSCNSNNRAYVVLSHYDKKTVKPCMYLEVNLCLKTHLKPTTLQEISSLNDFVSYCPKTYLKL